MQTITVKLDYATMRFLKEMMKEIKEIKNNSRRSRSRHDRVGVGVVHGGAGLAGLVDLICFRQLSLGHVRETVGLG